LLVEGQPAMLNPLLLWLVLGVRNIRTMKFSSSEQSLALKALLFQLQVLAFTIFPKSQSREGFLPHC
jgi:hypothetical protein